jgi:integrase
MTHERDRVLVRLLAYGGTRVGEAFALRWVDVDLGRGMLMIRESVEDSTGPVIAGPTKTYADKDDHAAQRVGRRSCPARR